MYAEIIESERYSQTITDSLTYIESQQAELSNLLDGYEAQANEIFDAAGGGAVKGGGSSGGLDFGPADQEREKSFVAFLLGGEGGKGKGQTNSCPIFCL